MSENSDRLDPPAAPSEGQEHPPERAERRRGRFRVKGSDRKQPARLSEDPGELSDPEGAPRREGNERWLARRGDNERKMAPSPSRTPMLAPRLAATLAPWPEPAEHLEVLLGMRRERKRRFLLRLALFCGLPTLLTALYMIFVASPRYVSEFQITYQTYQAPQKLSSGLVSALLGESQGNLVDYGVILDQYIRSPTLLKKLDAELHLREYFSSRKVDYISRMNPNASLETFLKYYHWYVSPSYALGGYLTVDVQAFDPQFALKLSQTIVKACDQMIDDITARARQQEVKYAEEELNREETRLRNDRLALTNFQDAHRDINPPVSASQLTGIVGKLQSDLSAARTQLSDMLSYMSPNSPQVTAIKFQIAALEKQLKEQQQILANTGDGTPYSKILEEYSKLQVNEEFAKNAYQAAQQGLEVARADAARQQKASLAIPVWYTLTALVVSLVLFGIGSLIAAAFRDHAGM
jgi:capsular polysaccharide transport system permease protein